MTEFIPVMSAKKVFFKTVVSGCNYAACHSCGISLIHSYTLKVLTFFFFFDNTWQNFKFPQLVNGTFRMAALFGCPCSPKTQIKYISTMKRGFDLGSEAVLSVKER